MSTWLKKICLGNSYYDPPEKTAGNFVMFMSKDRLKNKFDISLMLLIKTEVMKKKILLMVICMGWVSVGAFAQNSAHKWMRLGDKAYQNNQYPQAEEDYLKAQIKKSNPNAAYNLGNTIYQQERFEEAIQQFESAAKDAKDPGVKGMAYHNLGNAYYQAQELEKSIDAYKNALRLRPNDKGTKHNLALAKQQLQMQQQQQQQQNQENDKEKQQQDQEQEEEQQQQDQENQQQQQDQQQDENEEVQQPKDLTKEEAEALLKIMEEEEKKVQQKVRKAKSKPSKSKKEW